MAIYHLSAQIIGRSSGRSVVAAAAYRSGERLHEERTDQTHDYTKRQEVESEIHTPVGAPEWMQDRERLWNAVDSAEKRKDAQLAREFNLALPKELDAERQRELVRSFVKEEIVQRGMVADVAIHRNDPNNPHAHVLVTMREVTPEGFGAKNREWNRPEQLEHWREQWADHTNRALERAGREERIDHRSLRAQGIEREPTRHLGPAAAAMERKHLDPDRGRVVREVREYNRTLVDFQGAQSELERERGILERHQARMEGGTWDEKGSLAVAAVERERGGPVGSAEILRESREAQAAVWQLAAKDQALERRESVLASSHEGAERSRQEWAAAAEQQKRDESWRGKIVDQWWGGRTASEVEGNRWRVQTAAESYHQYLKQAGHTETGELQRELHQVRQQRVELKEERERQEARRGLYGPAAAGYERHREASLERDPEIQARHQARLESGVWRPKESLEMARLEVDRGGPVTREWLREQAGRESNAWNAYSRCERSLEHAEELGRYQEGLASGSVQHDRTLDAELKEIGREAMRALHPEEAARELAHERMREDLFWSRSR